MKKICLFFAVCAAFAMVSCKPDAKPATPDNTVTWGGVTYHTVTLKDGRTWLAENLRYVPEGKKVMEPKSEYTQGEGDGIYYPEAFSIDEEGNVKATPTNDPNVVAAQGLLYTAAAAMNGAEFPQEDWKDAANIQGICPDGWHIPTAQEWVDLVGACADTTHINRKAPYYDAKLSGAALEALNADGFNLLPYPYINQGRKYVATYSNKREDSPYNKMCSMAYFLSSTAHSATQNYAGMITNINAKSSVNCAYNFLTNAVAVRCIKNK